MISIHIKLSSPVTDDYMIVNFEFCRIMYLCGVTVQEPTRCYYNDVTRDGFIFFYEMNDATLENVYEFAKAVEGSTNELFKSACIIEIGFIN